MEVTELPQLIAVLDANILIICCDCTIITGLVITKDINIVT